MAIANLISTLNYESRAVRKMENELINLLLMIPGMNDRETRNLLLRNLPTVPISLIARYNAARQDLTSIVSYVIQCGQIADREDFAIEILIENARSLVRGLTQDNQLAQLHQKFQEEIRQDRAVITIPFVIVSMTIDEATDLGEMFSSSNQVLEDEIIAFRRLTESLQTHSMPNFTEYYGHRREDWKPYSCTHLKQSIEAIMLATITEFNSHPLFQENNIPVIRPRFVSTDFFGANPDIRVDTWDLLGQQGCVIIVDAVSLFHPDIRSRFLDAQIIANEKTSILTLSPINPCNIEVNKILEDLISSKMQLAFLRFNKKLDKRCEIGLGDLRAIKRWLFSILPEAVEILSKRKPQSERLEIVRNRVRTRNRIEQLWTGEN